MTVTTTTTMMVLIIIISVVVIIIVDAIRVLVARSSTAKHIWMIDALTVTPDHCHHCFQCSCIGVGGVVVFALIIDCVVVASVATHTWLLNTKSITIRFVVHFLLVSLQSIIVVLCQLVGNAPTGGSGRWTRMQMLLLMMTHGDVMLLCLGSALFSLVVVGFLLRD